MPADERPTKPFLATHAGFSLHASAWRAQITPAGRGSGQVRVMASIEDPAVTGKILAHLETKQPVLVGAERRPEVRGPPPGRLTLR